MNLVEIYVSNITEQFASEYTGLHVLTADTDCYGKKETQQELFLTDDEYKSVKEKGYYLG
ncbi:hypothetical protein [Lachnoclostridium phytofermentans]|uniref:hypothetical protein n=1 Tax=Lachnoclostridium phytofermentans TaxID=66219 RepID=UPI000495A7A8|nr:hypothetical protein [Lachnoclostridium phytofermentans]